MRKPYASDISREKFEEILPVLQGVRKRTKPTTVDLYEVFCAVLYLLRTGCQWRFLPREFPKWQTVYAYFSKWSKPGIGIATPPQLLRKAPALAQLQGAMPKRRLQHLVRLAHGTPHRRHPGRRQHVDSPLRLLLSQ